MIGLPDFFPLGLPGADAEPRLWRQVLNDPPGLLDWADLEQMLAERCFLGSGSAAIADALGLAAGPSRVYLLRGGVEGVRLPLLVDPASLLANFSGATLRIEAVEELHPPLARFAAELREVGPAVYCNAYAAWGNEPGLALHYDYTDVLVLQLRGEKHWRVYRPTGPVVRGPASSAYKEGLQRAERGEGGDWQGLEQVRQGLFWEGTLAAGDALYVPPGWFHSVLPTGGPTLHLACAFRAPPGLGGGGPVVNLPEALRS